MPVKLGTKRGSYKKKIKTDENTINKLDNLEIANEQPIQSANDKIIESVPNETIVQNEIDSTNIEKTIQSNVSDGNNTIDEIKQQPQRNEFQSTSGEEKLNSFFNEYQQINDETTDNKNFIPDSSNPVRDEKLKMIINGYMLLSICDIVFPYGIKFLFGFFNPKAKKVNAADLKLEPEQRAALLPAADQVAQYVFEKANPMTIFIICMGLFYGTNFSNALNEIKEK